MLGTTSPVDGIVARRTGSRISQPSTQDTGQAQMSLKGKTAIVGLGITEQGKVYDTNHVGFAVEAVRLALEDAGLTRDDLDGLLVNPGLTWGDGGMGAFQLQQAMGLRNLRLSVAMSAGGATACAMIQQAAEAIDAGL